MHIILPPGLKCIVVLVLVTVHVCWAQTQLMNELSGPEGDALMENRVGWIETAKNALAAPAGQMAVHFAKELISRSAGNSQILSLNVSNLLVLLLLKALIFAAGMMGAGNWGQYGRGRSDSSAIITNDEPALMLGYLIAEGSGDDSCLRRAACLAPAAALEYVRAAKALLQGSQYMTTATHDGQAEHYREMIKRSEMALMDGMKGTPCDVKYRCSL